MSNVETMFDANRPMPWENLGEKVFGALNSNDAIKAAKLDWFVYPMPVYSEICYPGRDPFKRKMKIAENFVANVRDRDDKILGIVTKKYKIIQNTEAFAFTDELLGNHNILYETAGSIDGGKRIWLLARIPAMFRIFDDDIDPYIVFTNTHDGSGAVKVIMTPVRVVCKNTLNLALQTAKRCWSASHIGNIKEKMIMARETLFNAKNYMDYLILSAEKLYKIKLATEKVEAIINAFVHNNWKEQNAPMFTFYSDRIEILSNGAEVVCVVENKINKYENVVCINDVCFSLYHPIEIEGKWVFPCQCFKVQKKFVDSWYNLVLKNKHEVILNGIKAITLGHNRKEGILKHPYFGTNKVIEALMKYNTYEKGFISTSNLKVHRSNNLIDEYY